MLCTLVRPLPKCLISTKVRLSPELARRTLFGFFVPGADQDTLCTFSLDISNKCMTTLQDHVAKKTCQEPTCTKRIHGKQIGATN